MGTHPRCPRVWGEVSWMRRPLLLTPRGSLPLSQKKKNLRASSVFPWFLHRQKEGDSKDKFYNEKNINEFDNVKWSLLGDRLVFAPRARTEPVLECNTAWRSHKSTCECAVTLDAATLIVPLGQCHVRQRALQLSAYALRPKPISAYVSVASIVYPAIVPGIKTLHKI